MEKIATDNKSVFHKNNAYSLTSFSVLIMAFSLFIYIAASKVNPDLDCFWLISTGRWIVENKGVPKINPWVYDNNLSVVIQQPLCAVLNYTWSNLFGITNMWILASIENIVLLISMINFVRLFSNNKTHTISTVTVMEMLIIGLGLGSTRPYQLTMACSFFLLASLEKCKRSGKIAPVYLTIGTVTLFQSYYQIASLVIQFCFLGAYVFGAWLDKARQKEPIKKKRYIQWILLFAEFIVLSFLNPYRLEGVLYLFRSGRSVSMLSNLINEMQSPKITSGAGFLIVVCLCCFIFNCCKQKEWSWIEFFLLSGGIISTILAFRNAWLLFLSFGISCTKAFNEKKPDKEEPVGTTQSHLSKYVLGVGSFIGSILVLFLIISISPYVSKTSYENQYGRLLSTIDQLPDDAKVYTSFNTGAFLEYLGRKIYVDARPELYSSEITKGKDVLSEWFDLEYGNMNFEEYIRESDWEYYLLTKDTPIEYFFRFSQIGDLIYSTDSSCLYKIN